MSISIPSNPLEAAYKTQYKKFLQRLSATVNIVFKFPRIIVEMKKAQLVPAQNIPAKKNSVELSDLAAKLIHIKRSIETGDTKWAIRSWEKYIKSSGHHCE